MVSTKRGSGGNSPMSPIQVGPSISSSQSHPVSRIIFSPSKSSSSPKSASSSSAAKVDAKFLAFERVLCYEPDPTKVKVVYDAKILEIKDERDGRGRVQFQYLVHFQGWKSSWDRFVPEEFLLKDNPESRALQRQLIEEAEEARISLNRSRKKKKRKRLEAEQLLHQQSTEESSQNGTESDEIAGSETIVAPSSMSPRKNQDKELPLPEKAEQHFRSGSPKKKKKKKRDKRRRLIIPEIQSDVESQPKIGKIVIVNGTTISPSSSLSQSPTSVLTIATKIATSSAVTSAISSAVSSATSSPQTATRCRSPSPVLTLRSASPKFSPKIVEEVPPVPEAAPLPQVVSNVVFRERKRKSSCDSSVRGILKSSKRTKTVSLNNESMSPATPTPPILTVTDNTTPKLISTLRIKDDSKVARPISSHNGVQIQQQRKARESFNGGYPNIVLSENLKRHLTADFEMVTKKRRVNILPSESCIVTVLEDFVRHYAAGRLVTFEKQQRKSMYTAHRRGEGSSEVTYQRALEAIQMCKEVAEGLRVLIDFNLQRSLLYAAEQQQFLQVMQNGVPARLPSVQKDWLKSASHEVLNGSSPTLSTAESAPSLSCSKPSARPVSTRKVEVHTPDPPPIEVTNHKRRQHSTVAAVSLSRRTSCETMTTKFSARSSTASNKDGGGSSCSTNSRSTATNRTSLLMPPVASSPSTPAANKVMRSIESWKLVPDSIHPVNAMPSLVYGPIHLLRLFVKLPEILGRMNLPPKTCKLIVKYMDAVLEYFEGHPDLFSPDMYE